MMIYQLKILPEQEVELMDCNCCIHCYNPILIHHMRSCCQLPAATGYQHTQELCYIWVCTQVYSHHNIHLHSLLDNYICNSVIISIYPLKA